MTRPLAEPVSFLVDSEETQYATRVAVTAERARIMRELDESVGKSLLGLSMIAESLASLSSSVDPLELDRRLHELASLARDAVSDARSFINGLNDDALGDEVRGALTGWGDLTGISASLDLGPVTAASPKIQREIVAVLREALSNVERHAHASRVHVCLEAIDEQLQMTVADDGSGFCVPDDLAELRLAGRLGLTRIDQRARELGGTLIVTSWPGLGTHLEVSLPAPAIARRRLRSAPQAPPVRVVNRAVEAGASGYVIHGEFGRDDLIQVVLDADRRTLAAAIPVGGRSRQTGLRPREREVMGLIAEGLTNRQIAARLVISEKTVKNHICSIYQHFGVHERRQAVSRWLEQLQGSAPAPGPLLGVEQRGGWPVQASPPGDGDSGHGRMDIQLAKHVLDMGAHGIS